MDRLEALSINMEMEDFLEMMARLKKAHGTPEIPIDDIAESLKHLSGTASASSIWDLKMMILKIQADGNRECCNMEKIPKELDDIRDDASANVLHIEKFISELDQVDKRMESQQSKIDSRLESLRK